VQDYDPFTTSPPQPGYPATPTGPHLVDGSNALPERIGRYRVEKVLGQGGFGLVYVAHDEQLQRLVAVKVPHARLVGDAEAYLAEARTVANLDHPNIVPVFDVGSTEQFPCFVVSKFIDGTDLASRLRLSRLSLDESVELVATVAEALHHAHRQGLVHRDIKPGNLLLDRSGKPFVADFGLALREQEVGKGPRFAGTPTYMSPEQARAEGHRVDGRSDIFSLGVVFYELLVGRRPFHGETRDDLLEQIIAVEARPPRQVVDTLPKELERICLKALAKRASERYTTAKDMADDLRHWMSNSDGHIPAKIGPEPTEPEWGAAPGLNKHAFLSYASADKEAASRLCRLLEEQGIGCWIAPRDVPPGADYGEAIIRAIETTKATLLLLSVQANASIHVTHEVERATSKRKRVIPVRLEEVQPGPSLELHLATAQWVDAWRLPPDQVAAQLALVFRGEWAATTPPVPPSSDQPLKIIPKGLRSFDAADADFFLELLPGPRDRDGLPDTIRFWKRRIEESETFSLGLIYGPSGCGKSSLVKAGLLPRLAKQVTAVYVEATAEETEARLLKGLRRQIVDIPGKLGLAESLAALRQGRFLAPGQKVLLVLDQFEQWLHATQGKQNTELVQALRQCDGGRVQCVVMVRDDFWLAVSRFMRDLEIDLIPDRNIALVDLFDSLHARKVLAAFGRAYGRLPDNLGQCTKEQEQFLDQAITGLAQDGKVVSVRLALFAEMVKGKLWTPTTLKEVGGTEGVGVTFLEETFAVSTAPPQHRLHQKAAQAVLKSLLPEAGTDIKGHLRSDKEILEASDYTGRPKDFDDLLRILDRELRLITPTDPEGKDDADPSTVLAGGKYYQLTHDYLVPSLRDWLTRKQKETRRGRAELLLADRAAVWNARPENRQLPSLSQWLQIKWLTAKKNWTPPQRKMMRKAGRYHTVRGLALAVLVAAITLAGLFINDHVVEKNKETHAAGLVRGLLDAETAQVPDIVKELDSYRRWTDPLLRQEMEEAANGSQRKLHASLALLPVDEGQVDYLYARLLEASPTQAPVILAALAEHKGALTGRLWDVLDDERQDADRRFRAACALADYDANQPGRWQKNSRFVVARLLASVQKNPSHYTPLLELLRPARGNLLGPLSTVYRDGGRGEAERSWATTILSDYAAGQPKMLADLLLDADEKQFTVIYPKFKDHGESGLVFLHGEIAKKPPDAREVFKKAGTIAKDEAKVRTAKGQSMPAKVFEVPLRAGKKYHVTMNSKDLDSFLVLQDKTGKELAVDDDSGGNLNAALVYTGKEDTYKLYAASAKGAGSFLLTIIEVADEDAREKLAKRQANAAVALLRLNQPAKVWPLLKHSSDPRVRSYLIHRLSPAGADAKAIVNQLESESDVTIRRALLLSLGEFGEKDFTPDDRKALLPKLQEMYRTGTDPGLHAASEWLLRMWKQEAWLNQINDEWKKDKEQREKRLEEIKQALARGKENTPPQWYVNTQGQTFVVIPGPVTFTMGSPNTEKDRSSNEVQHRRRIGRSFAIAVKSVTLAQYRSLTKDSYEIGEKYTRHPDLPVVGISWYMAAKYCNLLSREEGIEECYETDAKGVVTKLKANYLGLEGYRLPTEAEMEYATRAGASTSRYYGETEELLGNYAWYTKNSNELLQRVGTKKPNDFGLFDMLGNCYTWCQEPYDTYPGVQENKPVDDKETDKLLVIGTASRVLRGGSFFYQASIVRSASRNGGGPAVRSGSTGFRPARTFLP
jgi:formylglycine-generating enzyme required for sulfatase activity